jgi:hypothetical protein
LNVSIAELDQLFKEEKLTDEQVEQLKDDVGSRHISILFLEKLEDGECIIIFTYMSSFNPF